MMSMRFAVAILLSLVVSGPLACGSVTGGSGKKDEGVDPQRANTDPEEITQIEDLPRAASTPVEAFGVQPQAVLNGSVESTYLDVETWLSVAASPTRDRVALATSSRVTLYSMPAFDEVWTANLPAGSVYAFHGLFDPPLLAFSSDGKTLAWLSGRQGESISTPAHVLVELEANTGEPLDAVAFQAMQGGESLDPTEGQPTPPNPNHLRHGESGTWLVGNPYSIVRVDAAESSAVKLQTSLTGTELSQAANGWSVADGSLVHKDGRSIEVECRKRFSRLDVTTQLNQAAIQCMGLEEESFTVLLVDLIEEEVISTWPAPAHVHAMPLVVPGNQVLAFERAQAPGDVMVLHLLTSEGVHRRMAYGEAEWTVVEE